MEYHFFALIVLPAIFMLVAILLLFLMCFLKQRLPKESWLYNKLDKFDIKHDVKRFGERIDLIVTVFVFLLLILVTFYYA